MLRRCLAPGIALALFVLAGCGDGSTSTPLPDAAGGRDAPLADGDLDASRDALFVDGDPSPLDGAQPDGNGGDGAEDGGGDNGGPDGDDAGGDDGATDGGGAESGGDDGATDGGDDSAADGGGDAMTCRAGMTACGGGVDGVCADVASDPRHCGACGTACPAAAHAAASCSAGRCGVTCAAGFGDCNGDVSDGCEADLSRAETCGACATRCTGAAPVCDVMASGAASCVSGCTGAESRCGAACVNTATSELHCGACGAACPTGPRATATCLAGRCGISCARGFADCDADPSNGCEADLSSATSCGRCGTACAGATPLCSTSGDVSACESGCAASQVRCGMECVDVRSNPDHCGACGAACPARSNGSRACVTGRCEVTCDRGFADCNGDPADGCEADLSTPGTCGACGVRCPSTTPLCAMGAGGPACVSGCAGAQVRCGTRCADLQSSPTDCGACGDACPTRAHAGSTCAAGRCGFACDAGFADCNGDPSDGCEADLSSPGTCGACGRACAGATPVCSTAGACISGCSAGQERCAGSCVDVQNDATNCGGCGTACPARPNATAACRVGLCVNTCNSGFGDCDRNAANGCEANLRTDAFNCGGCGTFCATGLCAAGVCTVPRTCDELHSGLPAAPSGPYTIDPDGAGGNGPITVHCDMTTGGGGWTLIYQPTSAVYNTGGAGGVPYSVNDATLRLLSTEVLFAHRDSSNGALSRWARIGMTPGLQSASPFGALATDETVSVSVEGGPVAFSLLRYGLRSWGGDGTCLADWNTSANRGRVCLTNTAAPFYAGWTIGEGNYCSESNQSYGTTACSASRRFTIGVRGTVCAGSTADCDRDASNGCEAALRTDARNCGGCGTVCTSGVCASGVCVTPRSCDELLASSPAAPSGPYVIDPDGAGGNGPITVHCDMTTDGGGWTLIYQPTSAVYNTGGAGGVPYSINDATLRSISTEVLFAHRDAGNGVLPRWAKIGMTPGLLAASPFGALATDETVSLSIEGRMPTPSLLRYGLRSWGGDGTCLADWNTSANRGRVCFTNSAAPFYAGWTIGEGNYCSESNQSYGATACSAARRFTIGVRGRVCAGNTADCDRSAMNGCEVSLRTDARNCGGCGTVCTSGVCSNGVCAAPRNCDELHAASPMAPSGPYIIDPDGAGGNGPITVHCDMTTDGGGWTLVYQPTSAVYNTGGAGGVPYSINDATLRSISTEVLFAYRDAGNTALSRWARIGMTPGLQSASPFGALATDETVSVSVEGGPVAFSLLRYGLRSWGGDGTCLADWNTSANRGRVCLTNTAAPFYAGWTIGEGNYCSESNQSYGSTACSAARRFTIGVRGTVCAGSTADCDRNAANGCEATLRTDARNCGGCGTVCTSGVCSGGVCVAPRTCDELHAGSPGAPSGPYVIDPDGAGGNGPITVYCDMATDGGGWTLIYQPTSAVYNTGGAGGVPYSVNDATLRTLSTQVLLAYRDAGNTALNPWVRFGMPANWRTQSPFGYLATDETVAAYVDGGPPVLSLLRYGLRSWGGDGTCLADWNTSANRGRICLTNTRSPFYAGWTVGEGNYCSESNQSYGSTACSAARRFTIGVR